MAIDLKLGKFAPGDVGQIEFYLRWLKKHEMRPGEEDPLGVILCAEKSDERIEVFELAQRGIRVSEYLTELPAKRILKRKLHDAVRLARRACKLPMSDTLADRNQSHTGFEPVWLRSISVSSAPVVAAGGVGLAIGDEDA